MRTWELATFKSSTIRLFCFSAEESGGDDQKEEEARRTHDVQLGNGGAFPLIQLTQFDLQRKIGVSRVMELIGTFDGLEPAVILTS